MGLFDDLASVKAADVKEPVSMPAGKFRILHIGLAKEHQNKDKTNSALRFPFRLIEALEDVDPEQLAASLNGKSLSDKEITYDFWMSESARFMFTNYAKSQGLSDQMTLLEMAEELGTSSKSAIIENQPEPMQDKNGQPILNEDGSPKLRTNWRNIVGEG